MNAHSESEAASKETNEDEVTMVFEPAAPNTTVVSTEDSGNGTGMVGDWA